MLNVQERNETWKKKGNYYRERVRAEGKESEEKDQER